VKYPALAVDGADSDLLAAVVDDFSPTAVEEHGSQIVVFFTDTNHRDLALHAAAAAFPDATLTARDVDDEDRARRSQENLTPVTVGRVTITPPWHATPRTSNLQLGTSNLQPPTSENITIVITPSMGFGTGHHATTRLCVAALQGVKLEGARVLDVGTGSGVLAIAACALGAEAAIGIDYDQDAITAANENLDVNPGVKGVHFTVADLRRDTALGQADVLLANLTGALLAQTAPLLLSRVRPGGVLILSGILAAERDGVVSAFEAGATLVDEALEEGWMGLTLNRRDAGAV
jgi:ribosomal protein L11 methyltransferase